MKLVQIFILSFILFLPKSGLTQDYLDTYLPLYHGWLEEEIGSVEEARLEGEIIRFIESMISEKSISSYGEYLQAEEFSAEELNTFNDFWERNDNNIIPLHKFLMLNLYYEIFDAEEDTANAGTREIIAIQPSGLSSSEFDSLYAKYEYAPSDSDEELEAIKNLIRFVEDFLGSDALEIYNAYLEAEYGSEEETNLYNQSISRAVKQAEIRRERAEEILQNYGFFKFLYPQLFINETGYAPPFLNETRFHLASTRNFQPNTSRVGVNENFNTIKEAIILTLDVPNNSINTSNEINYVTAKIKNSSNLNVLINVKKPMLQLSTLCGLFECNDPDDVVYGRVDQGVDIKSDEKGWFILKPHKELDFKFYLNSRQTNWISKAFLVTDEGPFVLNAKIPLKADIKDTADNIENGVEVALNHSFFYMIPFVWIGGILVVIFKILVDKENSHFTPKKLHSYIYTILSSVLFTTLIVILNDQLLSNYDELPNIELSGVFSFVAFGILIQLLGQNYILGKIRGLFGAENADMNPEVNS